MEKIVVYIGSFSFPLGDAVAKRVLGIGKVLNKCGYSVYYIGESSDVEQGKISEDYKFEQFKYCNLHKPTNAMEHYKYKKDLKNISDKLEKWNKNKNVKAVIFCGTKCSLFANKLISVVKEKKIPIIADSMDWLQIYTGNKIFDIVKKLDIMFELCYVNKRADAIIAISSFLSDYYSLNGMRTIVIPPLSPYNQISNEAVNKIPIIVYGGVPCRLGKPVKKLKGVKDRLDLVVEMLYIIHQKKILFNFKIYGLTCFDYCILFPRHKKIVDELIDEGKITFYGRVNENIVKEAVNTSDFTILFRDKNRTSMAGFPTKISESISLGTPVITNSTSDIAKYIRNSKDGFIIDTDNIDNTIDCLRKILTLEIKEIVDLKMNVLENESFKPETYVKKLSEFFNNINKIDKRNKS